MSDYYTFGDHTKIKRLGIQKKKPFSLVTIGKAFKEGECHDDLLDLIDDYFGPESTRLGWYVSNAKYPDAYVGYFEYRDSYGEVVEVKIYEVDFK